ncbi:MAG: pyridoxamine 5'-phosphate oxidase family protein [Methylobacteriaceae bacterium]|nr:pyridoxamine 5'-phosphate oxidase family protein [Methylobacteriaceae bacterium]
MATSTDDRQRTEISTSGKDRDKVWDLIKDIRIAMLVTQDRSHKLSARPMAAANRDFKDGVLWFFARQGSPKLDELAQSSDVLLAYSHPGKQDYVSLSGKAQVVRDPKRVKDLWSEAARVWFPKGPDEGDIVLIAVDVDTAEYWDSPSATVVYAYGYAKAALTGEPPKMGENKKVAF